MRSFASALRPFRDASGLIVTEAVLFLEPGGRPRFFAGERGELAIGLLLRETHNSAVVEDALRDVAKPIGVSTFRVSGELPAPVRSELPTIEALQGVIAKMKDELKASGSMIGTLVSSKR